MQPTLAISASIAGVIYANGRFAGECDPDTPMYLPVAPRGAVYLEYHPLEDGARALARKLVFSEGRPIVIPEDLYCVCWPGGVVEVELGCENAPPAVFGNVELPSGAEEPEEIPLADGQLLLGGLENDRYAATIGAEGKLNSFARFSRLRHSGEGRLLCVTDRGDLVGHAVLEHWQATGEGLRLLSSEGAWIDGAPRWPHTAEDTALAAFEASFAGLTGEADGYLAPELRGRNLLKGMAGEAVACGRMKYAPPDAGSAVALFVREAERLASVQCIYFRATPAGGSQGTWQIAALWADQAGRGG